MAGSFLRARPRTGGEQLAAMGRSYPSFASSWRRGEITWIGTLQPAPLCATYTIQIRYRIGRRPAVTVLDPPVVVRSDGTPIPHVYPGTELCLYHPDRGEWSARDFVADTIVPWTSLWLLYYEAWQATGTWLGGGEHPTLRGEKGRRRGSAAPPPAPTPYPHNS